MCNSWGSLCAVSSGAWENEGLCLGYRPVPHLPLCSVTTPHTAPGSGTFTSPFPESWLRV